MGLPSLSTSGNDTKKSLSPAARGRVLLILRAPRFCAPPHAAAMPGALLRQAAPPTLSTAQCTAAPVCRAERASSAPDNGGLRAPTVTGHASRKFANIDCSPLRVPARVALDAAAMRRVVSVENDAPWTRPSLTLRAARHCQWQRSTARGGRRLQGGEGRTLVDRMEGLSRSELRQMQQIQAAEAKEAAKNKPPEQKAEKPAAKTPARPTTGGKTAVAKGRASAGGKSTGGKRPPQQAESKKRKKKKGDSSDESSDSSSSSSSEDEPQASRMPLKKRGKMTPQTPKADSGDESSEFEDEYDANLFKGEDDKQWIFSLTEFDRQQIIAERREAREIKREVWLNQHRRKKAASSAPAKSRVADSLARGSRRDSAKETKIDKNAERRAALEDLQAKKAEEKQKKRADVMEEDSDDDSPRKKESSKKETAYKPRHRQIPQEERYPRLERKQMEEVRVSRNRLLEYAQAPFFGEFAQGLYVRVSLGVPEQGGTQRYLLCQVIGVKDKQTEYQVDDPVTKKPVTLRKQLTVSHAGQKKSYSLLTISNKEFEESEVNQWCKNMHKERESLPTADELKELKAKLDKKWKEEFTFTAEITDEIVSKKKKEIIERGAGNLTLTKLELEDQMAIAWEEYKELQSKPTAEQDQEKQDEAYKKWEELKRQVEVYEEAKQSKAKNIEEKVSMYKVINSRNMTANRTVTKELDFGRNITSTRPYRQTVYFAFGQGAQAGRVKVSSSTP